MGEKLSKSSFQWITSTLIGIMVLIIGVQQGQISSIRGEVTAYKSDMYQEVSVIKTDLGKVSTNVEWLVRLFDGSDITIE